jgi:hypothetical protein
MVYPNQFHLGSGHHRIHYVRRPRRDSRFSAPSRDARVERDATK